MQQFIGWFISTLLLRLLGVGGNDSENEMQPSKYTQTNINQIGSTIPAVLGRVMIKNPLISYYGGFEAKIYTEEYGLWSYLDALPMILLTLITGLASSFVVREYKMLPAGSPYVHVHEIVPDTKNGIDNKMMMDAVKTIIWWLLTALFADHLGRVTIQKGFKYYLGWQNILCWSGEKIGLKKIWMNIYDTEVEDSTMKGAWHNDNAGATPYKLYEDNKTINITTTTYTYELDLMDKYYIDQVTFWFDGVMPTGNTSYISQVEYFVSDDVTPKNWQSVGIENPPGAGQYLISHTVPANTTGVFMKLELTCINLVPGNPNLNISDIIVYGKEIDAIAYLSANPTGIIAKIDDDEMFGGWDEGGGFIGHVNVYFGGYQQQKDPWMVQEMTNSDNIPQNLKGLTPLYPMYMTCVVRDNDDPNNKSGAYIGKQATIPEMWFEVVNYPDYLGTNYHAEIRQLYVDKLADLWWILTDYIKTIDPKSQAVMQPFMDACVNEWNNFIVAPNDDTSGMQQALENAHNAFANQLPTDLEEYEAAEYEVYQLVKHGVWTLGKLEKDLNPAEALYEILTNKVWGCSYEGDRIDIDSLLELGTTCESEQLGISMLMNTTQQAREYISKIMQHINGVFFDNPLTGKLVFRLMRNDFDINKIKHFNVANCVSCEFSRLDWSEAASSVSVKFTDARDKYNTSEMMVNDLANKLIVGSDVQKQVDGSYFTTSISARWMAQAQLQSAGYPLSMVNLECNRIGFDTLIGDPILVSWEPYGISRQVFRVIDVDYATLTNGKISISAVEDVFSFDKTQYEFSDAPIWDEPEKRPYDVARYMFMEMPYELSPIRGTPRLDTFMFAYATQPSNYTIYWNVWRYYQGNYNISTRSQNWTTGARFVYGLDEAYDFDTNGFEIVHAGTNSEEALDEMIKTINKDPNQYNHTSGLNILIVSYTEDTSKGFVDREIMSFDTIKKLPNGHYMVQGVVRGVYDTVPKRHTIEALIFFNDHKQNVTGGNTPGNGMVVAQGQYKDEELEIRTETATQAQQFDLTQVETIRTTRRSEQPSIMGNLKFGADRGTETKYWYSLQPMEAVSGDLVFTFLGRNKFNNFGIIEQTDATTVINVAASTQNVISISCNGETFEQKEDAWDAVNNVNITSMRLKWADFCKNLNNKVSVLNSVNMRVKTYDKNKDLYSHDEYYKEIQYNIPRIVGILDNSANVQAYADSIVQPANNAIIIPQTPVSPQLAVNFEDCPLIFIGTPVTVPSALTPAYGQDGNPYILTTDAYRVDGYDSNGNAIIHKITIDEEYIVRTNFTALVNNYEDYFRYRNGTYGGYTPY